MALDSKQKRGSAMLLGQPWRGWLAEPTGTVTSASRISLRWWCSAVPPTLTLPDYGGILGYRVANGLMHYRLTNEQLHYVAGNTRPHYRVGHRP